MADREPGSPEALDLRATVTTTTSHHSPQVPDSSILSGKYLNPDGGYMDLVHVKMLAASGITAEHAQKRGYRSMTYLPEDREYLSGLGFTTGQINRITSQHGALLIPLLKGDGSVGGYQLRPDNPYTRIGDYAPKYASPVGQPNVLDVPPGVGPMLPDVTKELWATEGSRKADCGALHGLCIVSVAGIWGWRTKSKGKAKGKAPSIYDPAPKRSAAKPIPELEQLRLHGRRVVLAFDNDARSNENVARALRALGKHLMSRGAKVEYLHLPESDQKIGLDDYLMDGHTVEDLKKLVKCYPPPCPGVDDDDPEPVDPPQEPVTPVSLDELHERFRYWFGEHYDLDAIDAALAVAAVEGLDGDPVWLLEVGGPGAAKTETITPIGGCEGAVIVSTISSPGALLSATSRRERAKDATGGLLRGLEPRGIMVLKDVTSILSLNAGIRAEILAALREVYDGYWSRNVGTDGGRTLEWRGRVAVIGAVTTEWDNHHAVISAMGDRFVLVRIDSTRNRLANGLKAIENTGSETQMREELTRLAAGVLAGSNHTNPPVPTQQEKQRILEAANLVALSRTAVQRDYRGDVVGAHAPEAPTRLAKQLTQLFRGACVIGLDRDAALRLVIRCARDSMPPLRLQIIDDLVCHPRSTPTHVRKRLGKPRATVDRELQALHMLGVVDLEEEETEMFGKLQTRWHYTLVEGIDLTALDPDSVTRKVSTHTHIHREERSEDTTACLSAPTYISGNGQAPTNGQQPLEHSTTQPDYSHSCKECGKPQPLHALVYYNDGMCAGCLTQHRSAQAAAKLPRKSDFDQIIPSITGGSYDVGMSSITDTKAREQEVDLVNYFSAGILWAQRPGPPVDPNNACGLKVAVQSTTIEETTEIRAKSAACVKAGKPPINKLKFDQQDAVANALVLGQVDAMSADSPVTSYAIKQSGGEIEAAGKIFDAAPYGWAVAKGSPLVQSLQQALEHLIENGQYQTILTKWGMQSGAIGAPVINGAVS